MLKGFWGCFIFALIQNSFSLICVGSLYCCWGFILHDLLYLKIWLFEEHIGCFRMYNNIWTPWRGTWKKIHLFWCTPVMETERHLGMLCTFWTCSCETFHHDLNLKLDWKSMIKKYHLYWSYTCNKHFLEAKSNCKNGWEYCSVFRMLPLLWKS